MAHKFGMTMLKNQLPNLKEAFHLLTLKDVMVGIPRSDTARMDEEGPINNATIGYIMEHGAPEVNIPARPTLIPGVELCKEKVVNQFRIGAKRSMKGDKTAAEMALNRAGLIAQNSVKGLINSGIPPELSERTLAARRRRGRTGTKPLVDTGQYRNSITYVLREK